ncbi:hypothetical protein, partial [Desulfovibrio sp.]|uniref:hypothetical protein n=1 Tax=Desulfovibrio sp. TaxID=885 RepID=UPI003077EA98
RLAMPLSCLLEFPPLQVVKSFSGPGKIFLSPPFSLQVKALRGFFPRGPSAGDKSRFLQKTS